jgi:hypothetical protein
LGFCSPWVKGDCGTVFELTPPSVPDGAWQEQILYSFNGFGGGYYDGSYPTGPLIFDEQGNLFGTTTTGGDCGYNGPPLCGTVFELSPPVSGGDAWSETILYVFNPRYGYGPAAGLLFDQKGNLYGTTVTSSFGFQVCYSGLDSSACGTVFKLTPPLHPGHPWSHELLHAFPDRYVGSPFAGLIADHHGSFLSTTVGYFDASGTVFEVTPPAAGSGRWTYKTVRKFIGGLDGAAPYDTLVWGKDRALYGTTMFGGESGGCAFAYPPQPPGCGTVFRIVLGKD